MGCANLNSATFANLRVLCVSLIVNAEDAELRRKYFRLGHHLRGLEMTNDHG